MLSHTTPEFLISKFMGRSRSSRRRKSLYVYERAKRVREAYSVVGECVQKSYFAGSSSGLTEEKVDRIFADEYEVPFNRIYWKLISGLPVTSYENVICARYVAHLFQRSPAKKSASPLIHEALDQELIEIASSPQLLRLYAAKVSLVTGEAIYLNVLKDAMLRIVSDADNRVVRHQSL